MPVVHAPPGHRVPPGAPHRKSRWLAVIWSAALVAILAPVVIVVAQNPGGTEAPPAAAVSGLPWSSGAVSEDDAAFAEWRGRPLDNITTWPNRETWDVIRNPDVYGAISSAAGFPLLTIGIAMLPEQEAASYAQCATGAYDRYYADVGRTLVRLGRGDTIVRLGWEANGDWYAWAIGTDVENYKTCFRRQVQAMRSTAPNVRIDWNMNKESKMPGSVADAYPGDDVVDIIGVDFYDMYPGYPDQAAWDADYNSTQNGGPRGLGTWLEFARSHGKKLSVPEWGLNTGTGGGTDSAFYVGAMHAFFRDNAADIAYETYFNLQDPSFMIFPAGKNPQGSARYRELWSPSP